MQYGVVETSPQFIERKIRNSEWFFVTGDINAVTNIIEYVPASGKTAYLFEAKIIISTQTDPVVVTSQTTFASADMVEASLKIDGIVKDTTQIGMRSSGTGTGATNWAPAQSAYGTLGDGRFICAGLSLAGDGIKKITIENITDNGSAIATMSGWISDT